MYSKIHKQISVLNSKVRFFGRTKTEDQLEALDQISELGTPYDAQYITKFLFSKNDLISQKTATVIRELFTKTKLKATWLKLYLSFSYSKDDDSINRKNLRKLESFPTKEKAHLYGIASLNHSGYIREEALDYLEQLSTSEILPYVLLRLNDWVPQVRSKAKTVLAKILPSIPVTDLIHYYNLIEWLNKTERVKLNEIQNKINTHLTNPLNRTELFHAMQTASTRERLFCWRALAKEAAKNMSLIDKAIADKAPEIRQWAALHLPKSGGFEDRLDILLSDPAIRVRYAALKATPRDEYKKYQALFERAIFDDSKPIREYARFVLRLSGDENFAIRYRRKLTELKGKANPGLVAGLAETGTENDLPLIKQFANHPNPKIRMAAFARLYRFKAKGLDHQYILGLQDKNSKVRNICTMVLQSNYSHLKPELENLLKNGSLKSQKASLKVLNHYGGLDSLKNILFSLTQSNAELQTIAWQYLTTWHQRHALKLWFSYNDHLYDQTLQLLNQLKQSDITPHHDAGLAWKDLPNIMTTIKDIQ